MEEARQHSALGTSRKVFLALSWGSYIPFVLGIAAQAIWGGHFFQVGLTLWPLIKFVAWISLLPEATKESTTAKRVVLANALLWLFLSIVIGFSVNAVLIWGR